MGKLAQRAAQVTIAPAQNSMVAFTDDSGSEITISQQDVQAFICPNATQQELVMFMELCRAWRLNPFLKECYLVKYGNSPAQMTVAKQVWVKRAHNNPNFDGMEHGIVLRGPNGIEHRLGTATYEDEKLLGGWCRVYLKNRSHPVYAEVSLKEMSKGQANWRSMPGIMIDKCAQSAALREAFPTDLGGLYAEEELGQDSTTVESQYEKMDKPQEAETGHLAQKATPDAEELRELLAKYVAAGFDEESSKAYLWSVYQEQGIEGARAETERATNPPEVEYEAEYEVE